MTHLMFTTVGSVTNVFGKRTGLHLGTITYDSGWKCSVFTPEDAQFSSDCLRDIAEEMDKLDAARGRR